MYGNLIPQSTFVRVEKLSFWQSPVKIRDVVGTPNDYEDDYVYKKRI